MFKQVMMVVAFVMVGACIENSNGDGQRGAPCCYRQTPGNPLVYDSTCQAPLRCSGVKVTDGGACSIWCCDEMGAHEASCR